MYTVHSKDLILNSKIHAQMKKWIILLLICGQFSRQDASVTTPDSGDGQGLCDQVWRPGGVQEREGLPGGGAGEVRHDDDDGGDDDDDNDDDDDDQGEVVQGR